MKTTGVIEYNAGAGVDVQTAADGYTQAVPPTVDVFTLCKEFVRKVAVNLPALLFLKLVHTVSSYNRVVIVEPAGLIENDTMLQNVLALTGNASYQRFELQPEAETGLVKARGIWLPTVHAGAHTYAAEDLRYIIRAFAMPSVERSYEQLVPLREGVGTADVETSERIYTATGLVSAIQKGIESDPRFAASGKQWGYIIDERNKHVYFVMHSESADRLDQIAVAEVNTNHYASFSIRTPDAATEEAAEFELV